MEFVHQRLLFKIPFFSTRESFKIASVSGSLIFIISQLQLFQTFFLTSFPLKIDSDSTTLVARELFLEIVFCLSRF